MNSKQNNTMKIDTFEGKRVLITGGAGFIGSNLAKRLVSLGAGITLVDSLIPNFGGNLFNIEGIRDKVLLNITDVRDPHAMAYLVQDQDFLFNLAGQTSHLDSMADPFTDLEINATAQLSILEACRKHNPMVRIVFASTRQLYGRPEYLPVDEKHPIRPVDVNGINKLAGEWYHLLYCQVYGIQATALRLTNTYGEGMRVKDARQTFLGIWMRNLIEGVPIKVFGDGKQLRDFNYVDDVVDALLMAATNPKSVGQVYNLGSSEVISLGDLACMLVDIHAANSFEIVPFPPERKAIDIGDYYSDYSKIKTEIDWEPKVSLAEGLRKTLDYYQKYHLYYWEQA
jgi:UDP-glucose 4-epimerase